MPGSRDETLRLDTVSWLFEFRAREGVGLHEHVGNSNESSCPAVLHVGHQLSNDVDD